MDNITASVCTLFEGHYHNGVAILSNSLYNRGFRGTIYVGYRGKLPNWVLKGNKEPIAQWKNAIKFAPSKGIELIFLELTTTYSLTNYKPNFMLEVWEGPAKSSNALFYFDPDIVLNDSWTCFEEWINYGIALCEDVNSPLQEFHPRRAGWRNYFKNYNIELQFKNSIYVNGGFVGLHKQNIEFLRLWKKIQEHMATAIGGLENSIFSNQTYHSTITKMSGFNIFDKSDQDALNATVEAYQGTISYLGKEGMGFENSHITMYHALGSPKPWKAKYFTRALKGLTPRDEDMAFWKSTASPIKIYTNYKINYTVFTIFFAKFIGRFYKN